MKGLRIAIAAFALSLFLFLAVGGMTVYVLTHKVQTTSNTAEEVRHSAIENCEANGNPLRVIVQGLLEEQISNAESPEIHKLFPQIPGDLLRAHIAADEKRLAEIAPINCQAQYPRP